jgi:signal transduction histidine kinase
MYSSLKQELWKPRTSVKVRFALIQGLFIAIIISLLATLLYFLVKPRFQKITNNSYTILTDNLVASINVPYAARDRQAVINAVRLFENQQGVSYVLILNSEGVVYYDSVPGQKSLEGKKLSDEITANANDMAQLAKSDTIQEVVTRDGTQYYNFAAPAPIAGSNKVSYVVRLGIERQTIDGEFNRLAQLFLYLAVAGVLIGILAAYWLASRLTKPIIALTESALAIRAGNLNAYPNITTNDELEQLSREFQRMVEKLKQFYFQEYNQKKQAVDAKKRLEEINGRLKDLDRSKTDFLNAASHQLRTPLSVIHWSLSIIVDEAEKLHIPDSEKELLTESLKSTKRMVDLVNDLLDLSRMEQGRKELSWAKGNYGKVCDDLVKALQPLAKNKNLTLTFEKKGEIPDSFLDEKNFYQVVNNFVDNSIKYTAEGWVKVGTEAFGDHIDITVEDSGIGMTDEEKKRLFTRFSRGDDAQKMFANGSGLGMFVAHQILEMHGGEVTVQSEKGHGTKWTLRVPIYQSEPPKKETVNEAGAAEIAAGTAAPASATPTPAPAPAVVPAPAQPPMAPVEKSVTPVLEAPAEPVIETIVPDKVIKPRAKRGKNA